MKVCVKCLKEINKQDSFIHLEEYLTGEKNREEYWHLNCFKDKEKEDMKKITLGLVARANKLMGKAEEIMS